MHSGCRNVRLKLKTLRLSPSSTIICSLSLGSGSILSKGNLRPDRSYQRLETISSSFSCWWLWKGLDEKKIAMEPRERWKGLAKEMSGNTRLRLHLQNNGKGKTKIRLKRRNFQTKERIMKENSCYRNPFQA